MSNLTTLQALDKSRQQAGKAIATLLNTATIETVDDAKRIINDAFLVNKSVDTAIADTLYTVFTKGIISKATYTDKNGKVKKCVTIADFAKTIPALSELSTASLYEYKDYGELRQWRIYRKDSNGNIVFGKVKTDGDGNPVFVDTVATLATGETVKDVDGNPIIVKQYDYTPAIVRTVVNGDKVENVTDGEPITDIYLTAEYIKVLSLYGKTKSAIVLKRLNSAVAILKLHENCKIKPSMTKNDLKKVVDNLLNKRVDITDKPTEDKPTEDKPTEDKPTEDKPTEDKPNEITIKITLPRLRGLISELNCLRNSYNNLNGRGEDYSTSISYVTELIEFLESYNK